jgi:hypothetical protein
MRSEGASTRQIAEEAGVSQMQVRKDLEEAYTETPISVEPPDGKVTGRDGKRRPARKPRPVSTPNHVLHEPESEASQDDSEYEELQADWLRVSQATRKRFLEQNRLRYDHSLSRSLP